VVNSIAGDGATIVDNARILFAVAGEQARPPRVIHLSTMSVYGSATGLVDERAPRRGDLGEYSSAKVEAERQAATHPNTVVLRPGIVYGPESPLWSELIGRLLLQRRLGDLGAAGDGICNLVHVDDVAAAVVAALRLAGIEGRAFNLSLPQAPTWNMYFARYAQALGAVPVRRIGSMRLGAELKLAGPLLKIGEALRIADGLRLPPPIRPWLIDQCRHAIQLDVQKAQDVLGMHWRTLDDGLRETAAWLQGRMQR
jgi:nucleoside-diphosphate-sugar epimerase